MTLNARICLCALLAAGWTARADQTFANLSSRTIFLQLHAQKLGSAVLRVQVHTTGKTPKIATPAIILEDPKSESKVCLNEETPRGIILTNATSLDQVERITLFPGNSATFTVLSPPKRQDRSNHLAFLIQTRSPGIDGPDFVDEHLDINYRTSLDPKKGTVEKLSGTVIKGLETKDQPTAPRFDFDPPESRDGLMSLVDRTPGKPASSCAIQ